MNWKVLVWNLLYVYRTNAYCVRLLTLERCGDFHWLISAHLVRLTTCCIYFHHIIIIINILVTSLWIHLSITVIIYIIINIIIIMIWLHPSNTVPSSSSSSISSLSWSLFYSIPLIPSSSYHHFLLSITGLWLGIELDDADGKNDGSVNGVSYFSCGVNRGVFAPPNRVQRAARSVSRSVSRASSTESLNSIGLTDGGGGGKTGSGGGGGKGNNWGRRSLGAGGNGSSAGFDSLIPIDCNWLCKFECLHIILQSWRR